MRAKTWLTVSTLLAAPCLALADEPPALEVVQSARHYAWGAVGTPAAVSPGEQAARRLARDARPDALLAGLPAASTEGKLYLLCVLRRVSPRDYAQARSLAAFPREAQATVFIGDILRAAPVSRLLRELERSDCDPLTWPSPVPPGH